MDKHTALSDLVSKRSVLRARDLAQLGVNSHDLRRLVKDGVLSKIGRGLYSSSGFEATASRSLVEAAGAQSKGVVCLLSALSYYNIGTQLPHQVWMAVPYGARISRHANVPMQVVVMRPPAYDAGIEIKSIEGVAVPVYCIAKTIADCFKFRNRVGLDVALEALRETLHDRRCPRDEIRKYARIDRVEKLISLYMEALSV